MFIEVIDTIDYVNSEQVCHGDNKTEERKVFITVGNQIAE